MSKSFEEIKQFFEGDRYAKFSGMQIDHAADYQAVCSMKIEEIHLNAGNIVQGGVIFTLADFAFAVAANSGDDGLTVSLSNNITFLRPPKGTILYAKAKKVSASRRTCFYDVLVTDDLDTVVAKMTVNGYITK